MPHATNKALTTIDISGFISLPTLEEAERSGILLRVKEACLDHGFFVVAGHGVPSELQGQVLEQARIFFALPQHEKDELLETKTFGRSHRGYQSVRGERLQYDKKPDLKEGFQMGVEKATDHPDCVAQRMLTGPNVWPKSLEPQFSSIMMEYHRKVSTLQDQMMKLIAFTLNIDYEQTFGKFSADSLRGLRLLHYPPQTDETDIGAGAHTDFGGLTCLLTDGVSGLQILDNSQWLDVYTEPGAYIVNLGDMMKRMTCGLYKSSIHRVINTSGEHRYSVPLFLDGTLDYVIDPVVDGPQPASDKLTVEQHMMERFGTARDARGTGVQIGY